jgi:protein gp37
MANKSKIEWTGFTWNPVRGCTKCSPGCANCYAQYQAIRQKGPGKAYEGLVRSTPNGPQWTNKIRVLPEMLSEALRWTKPRMVFVNSMSDLFHPDVPDEFIVDTFKIMARARKHTFQVLTKRSERLAALSASLPWSENIWMCVSIENADYTHRIDDLRTTGAHIKFLSLEPLLGSLPRLNLQGIDQVIVGGESGPGARPMDVAWVRDIRDQCIAVGVKFFFKQFGRLDNNPDKTDPTAKENGGTAKGGRMLDGQLWDEMPQ